MVALSTLYKHGQEIEAHQLTFSICPGSVIDLDSGALPLGFLPVRVPRVVIQCGERGERGVSNNDDMSGSGMAGFGGIAGFGSIGGSSSSSSTTSSSTGTGCIIRGGGKRNPLTPNWNTNPNAAYKLNMPGIVGGGIGSIAQIYIYGETAFDVTLKGLTFDNTPSLQEVEMYNSFLREFGDVFSGVVGDENDDVFGVTGASDGSDGVGGRDSNGADAAAPGNNGAANENGFIGSVTQQDVGKLTGSSIIQDLPPVPSNSNNWDGATELNNDNRRNLQGNSNKDNDLRPANRFAAIAVKGHGYGDDAGPRIVTIDNCKFEQHRGYAVLVSPGIQEPDVPLVPKFEFPPPSQSGEEGGEGAGAGAGTGTSGTESVADEGNSVGGTGTKLQDGGNGNAMSSGQSPPVVNENDPFGFGVDGDFGINEINNDPFGFGVAGGGGEDYTPSQDPFLGGNNLRHRHNYNRKLNLLDNGGKFIPQNGLVTYYDDTSKVNYRDGRRVKIMNSEFINNNVEDDHTAGLITSAYSLTVSGCFFQKNNAKAMVFVYNNDALVENTIFAENTVEVSTVVMSSPKGSTKLTPITNTNGEEEPQPTHIVERSCFMGSNVGMANVLVTDVANTGFGQRDNHAKGTAFTWASSCEGSAAEKNGDDCLESGLCDGTCIQFTAEACLADKASSFGLYSSGVSVEKSVWVLGTTLGVAIFTNVVGIF